MVTLNLLDRLGQFAQTPLAVLLPDDFADGFHERTRALLARFGTFEELDPRDQAVVREGERELAAGIAVGLPDPSQIPLPTWDEMDRAFDADDEAGLLPYLVGGELRFGSADVAVPAMQEALAAWRAKWEQLDAQLDAYIAAGGRAVDDDYDPDEDGPDDPDEADESKAYDFPEDGWVGL